eukprot:922136-Prymnesium_polylepis.1
MIQYSGFNDKVVCGDAVSAESSVSLSDCDAERRKVPGFGLRPVDLLKEARRGSDCIAKTHVPGSGVPAGVPGIRCPPSGRPPRHDPRA